MGMLSVRKVRMYTYNCLILQDIVLPRINNNMPFRQPLWKGETQVNADTGNKEMKA